MADWSREIGSYYCPGFALITMGYYGNERYLHPETFAKLEDRQLKNALATFCEPEERLAQNGRSPAISD
jgi:hypothetical protein